MFDAEKLSAARWSVRDILQYLKNNHRVKRTHVEKAVRCLNEAGFEVSAKMLEAEFRPVFQGKKITTELSSSIQSLYDGVDAAISVRMADEAHAIISQRRINQETVATPNTKTQSDDGSVLPSSKPENLTKTDDNCDTALACVRLQPYVEKRAFREYLKRQILEWEVWHRSQVDEIRKHESWLDHDKEQLEHSVRQGTGDPDDPVNTYMGSDEWHIDEVASIRENLEFRLVAELEPDRFEEASIAAMVALFWCDINRKNMLVPEQPDFDFLDPHGTFQKYLFEQWEKPIQGRYKHIDWFVEAAISAYERTSKNNDIVQSKVHDPPVDPGILPDDSDTQITEKPNDPEPRLVASDGEHPQATVDGKPISINKKQAELIRLLLDAHGEYVSLADHKFRSRDVQGLPEIIRQFVETQPGAGTRIPRDQLLPVKDT